MINLFGECIAICNNEKFENASLEQMIIFLTKGIHKP